MRLTKTVIDHARPRDRQFTLWDDRLGGFGCTVFPSGKRSFMLRYRLPGSRKRYDRTIGGYGAWTVDTAREEAGRMLSELRTEQRHPMPPAEEAANTLTVTKLVGQYSAALQGGTAATKRLRGRAATDGYLQDTLLHLERFTAAYGEQAADATTRRDVVTLLNTFIKQPSAHRRLHGAIHRMYAWARKHELVTNNPTADIDTTTQPPRERVLSLNELARIWRAATDLEPVYCDLVQLMITTGQRRAEVAGITWGEIDLARGLWTLSTARTKARRQHVLPLPSLALAVLQQRRHTFKRAPDASDLVLPSLGRDGRSIVPVSGWNWLKRELDKTSGLTDWQLHDFRRSLVTICAEHGADVATLDSMLNHASSATRGGVIGTYQRATLVEPMRKAMALWDGLLQTALAQADGTNVVALVRD